MNTLTLAVIGLRAAALALTLAVQPKAAATLNMLADLVEAGKATDEHMAEVAAKLKSGPIVDTDWDDLFSRISSDRARLHSS